MYSDCLLDKLIKYKDEDEFYFEIANLKIFSKNIGVVGELTSPIPTKIIIENLKHIYGYTLSSTHENIYMEYISYIKDNIIYAFAKGTATSGHSTRLLVIGV